MVYIKVSLSNDKMLAYISGSLDELIPKEHLLRLIGEKLLENKVVFGLQEKLLSSAATELLERKKIDDSIVAIGEYPKPELFARVRFLVPTIVENALDPELIKNIHTPIPFYLLHDMVHEPYIVQENEPVGKMGSGEKGEQGFTVLGEPMILDNKSKPPDDLGQGLLVQYDSSDIIAMMRGVIVRKNNYAYIIPVNLDSIIEVTVSKDRLKAHLSLFPHGLEGKTLQKDDVFTAIKEKNITFGINTNVIEKAFETISSRRMPVKDVCIAEGKAAIPGEDARIDYKVNLSFSHAPVILHDGRADYYSLHLFENVDEKQTLARVKPPTDGVAGIDVYGMEIQAQRGKDIPIAVGKNVALSAHDNSLMVATKTGHVYVRNDNLLVEEVLKIATDVDYNTGDIDFIGDVEISGDIKSGFSVKAGGSVSVKGAVEDAFVEAGNSVIIHSGFIGKGRGRIRAGHDVVVKHVRNQTILAKNNIMIDGESLDANLFAGNEMFVEIKKSWIVGGVAVARNKVRAFAIGSESEVQTEVAAGVDLFVKKILEELEKEIVDLEQELNIISLNEKRIYNEKLTANEREEELRSLVNKFKMLRQEHEKKIKQLEKYKNHYNRSLYDIKGTVGVIDTIYPGVTIKIGKYSHLVQTAIKKCLFYVYEDTIRQRSFSE